MIKTLQFVKHIQNSASGLDKHLLFGLVKILNMMQESKIDPAFQEPRLALNQYLCFEIAILFLSTAVLIFKVVSIDY